jgi:hypothetical protein
MTMEHKPTSEPEPWAGCMVFDERGNAFDAFDYTPEELERHARLLRGVVTIEPSPFVLSTSAEVLDA